MSDLKPCPRCARATVYATVNGTGLRLWIQGEGWHPFPFKAHTPEQVMETYHALHKERRKADRRTS